MQRQSTPGNRLRGIAWPSAAALMAALILPAQAGGPFAGFAGSWSGGGQIAMTDGSNEEVRCTATYTPASAGASLEIHVACTSDSYKVDISSDVVANGTSFSGSWREATRQAQGSITGRVPVPGELQADLEGIGVNIKLAASTNGRRQAVTIASQGNDVRSVKIMLRRG